MINMDVKELTNLIYNHNMLKKSFEKVKICGVSFIRWNKNGNTYFEYDQNPHENDREVKMFMNEQITYLNLLLNKELEVRKMEENKDVL